MKWAYEEELRANFSMIASDDGHVVAGIANAIPGSNYNEDLATQRKDARLIIAAPKLLQSLIDIVKMVEDGDLTTIELDEAKATIAEAGGVK